MPNWPNEHHNALFKFVIVTASLADLSCLTAQYVWTEQGGGIDRHVF